MNGLYDLLQASYTLSRGQNVLSMPATRFSVIKTDSELLQASYTLFGGHDGLSELLQASYTLCGCQNGLTFCGGEKMDSPSFYKSPTRLAVIKTDSPSLPHAFRWSFRASTSLLHA